MSFSLDDVRVIPLTNHGGLIKVQSSPAASPASSNGDDSDSPKSYSNYGNKHHGDSGGVPFEAIPITAIVFTFIFLIVKAIMAPFTQRARQARYTPGVNGGLTAEEIAILQKLQRTLSQMESRVEALETILIDQARTEKHYGPKL